MRNRRSIVFIAALLVVVAGCGVQRVDRVVAEPADAATAENPVPGSEPGEAPVEEPSESPPVADPDQFTSAVDNPWFPLVPGTVRVFRGESDGEEVLLEATVTSEQRVVAGVTCTVVHAVEFVDGDLSEETRDFYAQDASGNVWYFGEETAQFEDGVVVSTEGSWEAGVGGAEAGLVMLGDPRPGDEYQLEYLPGVAEDRARVQSLETTVVLSDGSSRICLQTKEWDPNDPQEIEYKYYAPGEGLVKEEAENGSSRLEVEGPGTAK